MTQDIKAVKHICSICNKEFEGNGKNAQPLSNDNCCDMCYYVFVLRYMELSNAIISAKERDNIVPVKLTLNNDVQLEYLKDYGMLTDYKKIFIREITADNLNDAISKLEEIYSHHIVLDWNYDQLTEQYNELINTI